MMMVIAQLRETTNCQIQKVLADVLASNCERFRAEMQSSNMKYRSEKFKILVIPTTTFRNIFVRPVWNNFRPIAFLSSFTTWRTWRWRNADVISCAVLTVFKREIFKLEIYLTSRWSEYFCCTNTVLWINVGILWWCHWTDGTFHRDIAPFKKTLRYKTSKHVPTLWA